MLFFLDVHGHVNMIAIICIAPYLVNKINRLILLLLIEIVIIILITTDTAHTSTTVPIILNIVVV